MSCRAATWPSATLLALALVAAGCGGESTSGVESVVPDPTAPAITAGQVSFVNHCAVS